MSRRPRASIAVKGLDNWTGFITKHDLRPAAKNPHELFQATDRRFVIPATTPALYLYPRDRDPQDDLRLYVDLAERRRVHEGDLVRSNADSRRWYRQARGLIESPIALRYDRFTVVLAGSLLAMTVAGVILNSNLDTRIVDDVELMPVVALWCTFNAIVLMIVLVTAFSAPSHRSEERFTIDEPVVLRGAGATLTGRIRDLSLSGMGVRLDDASTLTLGDWLAVTVGRLTAH